MNGKVVLVTGSSRGIGRATIIEFASKGYNVVINYVNNEKEANEFKDYVLNNYKVKALVIKADVSNETDVKNMIDTIIRELGRLDVLVNNAGIAIDNNFYDKTVEEFRKVLDVNLIGTYLVSKYASIHMLDNKYGKIINISSTNGIDTGYPEGIDYDASKAGVISLTHNLAKQLSPYINVNSIASGWVNTDATKEMGNSFRKEETDKIFLKRFAEPSEIAKVIVFLASDDASYINDAVIRVDGGF
jgi:3-oxoacyl-[acyl-carrier protein] reductase